mmetsp:Transcript_9230/g.16623  ORF Transcript_9230/g.16623 Transcript_9230/m.16623 type:complete len:223 (-) Transcript_9230:93-761(-)
MCKQANPLLICHIVATSLAAVCVSLAMYGTWFTHEVDNDALLEHQDGPSHCRVVEKVSLNYVEYDSKCWASHRDSWDEACEAPEDKPICDMWRPSLTLHTLAFIQLLGAVATASVQGSGCCCPGSNVYLSCSFGFTISAAINLLIGFALFSSLLHVDDTYDEYRYSWGWGFSFLSIMLMCVAVVISGRALFCQKVHVDDSVDDKLVEALPGAVPVGKSLVSV